MDRLNFTRRAFLKASGAFAALAGTGLAADKALAQTAAPTAPPTAPPTASMQDGMTVDEMDKAHEAGVKAYLDNAGKNKNFWGNLLPYTLDGSTKVFQLEITEGPWETTPGTTISALMYNGQVPGPVIRVTEGDKVRVIVNNKMPQSTAVHFHGVHTSNAMDGVPFITQPPIKTGTSFTYEFVATPQGSHMYHSHHNSTEQVTRGLFGAFIIDPLDKAQEPRVDAEYVMVLNDSGLGFTLNGKSFPSTQPISAKIGDRIRIRYFNEGLMIHPMHLHGMYQQVIAKDGANLASPYLVDTLLVAPGERYDVLVDCLTPGVWAYHCHILSHAEGPTGMYGMVTVLIIQ
jgi:FtsP/CotA-like multicopper oxidase with cupredoxin domain